MKKINSIFKLQSYTVRLKNKINKRPLHPVATILKEIEIQFTWNKQMKSCHKKVDKHFFQNGNNITP